MAESLEAPGRLQEFRGRVVRIQTQGGEAGPAELLGKLRSASAESIEIERGGHRSSVPVSIVKKVEALPRGRWRGLVIGAVVWGAAAWLIDDGEGESTQTAESVGAGAMAGAAVGALLDYSTQPDPEVIYERPDDP